jgi:acetyl-CoA acetyltransferase
MPDPSNLKDKIAVIGVGNTKYGNFPDIDDYGLAAHAFRNAVEDCGIDKNKIDGMLVCRIPYYARMGEILGLNPRWTLTLPGHGRMSGMGIIEAATAIAAGHADYVALMYANIGRSRRVNYGGDESPGNWDRGGLRRRGRRMPWRFAATWNCTEPRHGNSRRCRSRSGTTARSIPTR